MNLRIRIAWAAPILLGILCLFGANNAAAQWQRLSQIDGVSTYGRFGCFVFKQGVFWAGNVSLYRSTDNCQSWSPISGTLSGSTIMGLDFYDRSNGILVDHEGKVSITHDGGITWTTAYNIGAYGISARFGNSQNEMLVGTESGNAWVSHDGGMTWASHALQSWVQDFAKLPDGSLRVFCSTGGYGLGLLYKSTDNGDSWTPLPGTTGSDVWSFAADSCDPNYIYLVNEEAAGANNQDAYIWVTTDGGQSWRTTLRMNSMNLAGSVALGQHSVYCQTTVSGVVRSTDQGATWKLIGGPNGTLDSRQIVAVTDNEIYAIGAQGDVWRTINSGGDSVQAKGGRVITTLDSLFQHDSVPLCNSLQRTSIILPGGCGLIDIMSIRLVGKDTNNYTILHTPPSGILYKEDSIVLAFTPLTNRRYSSRLEIRLSTGEVIVIELGGAGSRVPLLKLATADVHPLTLGQGADVPLFVDYQLVKPDCDLVVDYDTSVMFYLGANYSTSGGIVAEVGGSKPGHHHLHLLANQLNADRNAAVVHFNYFPLKDSCTDVAFDSINVSSALACASSTREVSNVCLPIGCGTQSISQFMRYGTMPALSLSPNPSRSVTNIFSQEDVGNVMVEVSNALGEIVLREEAALLKDSPLIINTSSLVSGRYFVRVSSPLGVRTLGLSQRK
jgi:photosystem II stability/assembly factor-like uncharacterized protein